MIVVLAYHSIQTDSYAHSVNPDMFEKQISWLNKHFEMLSLADLENLLRSPRDPNGNKHGFAVVTFDDGLENVLLNGAPVLTKYTTPATVFFPTSFAGKSIVNTYGINYSYLNWDQMREMEKTGLFSIQSHGHNHLTLPDVANEEAVEAELTQSLKSIHGQLGKIAKYFAYPKGKYDNKSHALVKKYFNLAFAGNGLIDESSFDLFSLPRIVVTRPMSFWKFKLSLHPWFWKIKNRRSSAS